MKDVRHMFIVKTCGKKANLRLFLEREGNKKCPLEHLLPRTASVYEDICIGCRLCDIIRSTINKIKIQVWIMIMRSESEKLVFHSSPWLVWEVYFSSLYVSGKGYKGFSCEVLIFLSINWHIDRQSNHSTPHCACEHGEIITAFSTGLWKVYMHIYIHHGSQCGMAYTVPNRRGAALRVHVQGLYKPYSMCWLYICTYYAFQRWATCTLLRRW